ncbi:hypothetical protein ABZY57_05820 [Streptomyces sp. NPDC006450]|uniref:hypothetical protein n=1 Tax=Streptomyces sp. NPDC006450 TaxID=3155458 RepID=UPI0033A1FAF5
MEETQIRAGSRYAGVVLVVVAGFVMYGWARWSLEGASAPSMAVAVAVGAAVLVAVGLGHLRPVGGSAGIFAALFVAPLLLALGLQGGSAALASRRPASREGAPRR